MDLQTSKKVSKDVMFLLGVATLNGMTGEEVLTPQVAGFLEESMAKLPEALAEEHKAEVIEFINAETLKAAKRIEKIALKEVEANDVQANG